VTALLVDWITARVPWDKFQESTWSRLLALGDRIMRYNPTDGTVIYESQAWESVRSDSHQVVFRVGSDALWIQGSPARCSGDGCAVFGSGPSAALDLAGCVERMGRMVFDRLEVRDCVDPRDWMVSRVDVTGNLRLHSLEAVRIALAELRDCEGGRYRVSQQAGDTVYWSHRSKHRSGKAYAKGRHLAYMMKRRDYRGREYSPREIAAADTMLRLELSLKREYWRLMDWRTVDSVHLVEAWRAYFAQMIGGAHMSTDYDVENELLKVAPTPGRAKAAYQCWCVIQARGWEDARGMSSKTCWYRNLQLLRAAGLGDTDLARGRVAQTRVRILDAQLVGSWAELLNVA
jgi:II/X family phage/plasmid replication protein